ncbi:MAG: hypothetical protein KBC17_03340 [Candidatus Pacebacteria bacterium]|nr:hypothetical protein [Candidatus Paceibacterota bacterium]
MADETKKISVGEIAKATSAPQIPGATSDSVDSELSEIQKEIASRYELLPEELQKIIVGDDYRMQLFTTAKELKLTYEELGTLEIETTMVLLGMTRPDDFRNELQIELKKNDQEIDNLVKIVNERIFAPVKIQLEKVYAAKKNPEDYLKEDILARVESGQERQPVVSKIESSITNQPIGNLTDKEKNVLEKTGVVLSDTPSPIKSATPANLPNRNDIIAGIENPTKTPRPNIVADKLSGIAPLVQNKVTDYTIPKTTPPLPPVPPSTPSAPKVDPYREKI